MEKHFSWWQEQIILPNNISLALFEIVQNFHYFCKVRACRISFKVQFSKLVLNCGETLLLMSGINNLAKKYFLSTIWYIVLNFHFFCKVRACVISVKNSIFQILPKIVEKRFSWWQEQIILPKNNFQALFEIVLNVHYFCKVRACRISVKNLIL